MSHNSSVPIKIQEHVEYGTCEKGQESYPCPVIYLIANQNDTQIWLLLSLGRLKYFVLPIDDIHTLSKL